MFNIARKKAEKIVCPFNAAAELIMKQLFYRLLVSAFKVNELRYMQYGVAPHFSTGQNPLKKILRKDKFRRNQLRKAFR